MAWLHKFSNFQWSIITKWQMTIRELEIMIRLINIEIILAEFWHVWLYKRSRTGSHGLSWSGTIAYTIIHRHRTRASFLKVLKIIHGLHGYTRMARV